ncbi:protein kinase domain-containing protein [Streptosporangium sp. DT93]|uniref:serine/threonine-protein kinase n=1 Tax=Streptosporangium sp. DT93 TaxID=3393428 RepID=UPI003CE67F2D
MAEKKVAGRYRLLEHIGEGGMGIVWRAHDELLDRTVAVKEVRYGGVDESARADLNRRTIREARTAGRLDHPSVVIVHDVVEEEGRPWIVMQLVRSRSLGEIVRVDGPLPPERVAAVGLHVLGALRAAHAAGVLHRDVKPENVLLADDGRVVLTDFGIASMTQEKSITRTGAMVGTPAFLPPERLHGLPATPESDLWSLGATLYAALEGRPPFERPTAAATMMAVLHGEPTPMTRSGPLETTILGLLARDPAARMNPGQAEALLGRAATGVSPSGPSPSSASPSGPSGLGRAAPGASPSGASGLGRVPLGGFSSGPSPSGHAATGAPFPGHQPQDHAFPGHRPPDRAFPGHAPSGPVSSGPVPPGSLPPGQGPHRHASPGHIPQGHVSPGHAPSGHVPPAPVFDQGAPHDPGGLADRPAPWSGDAWPLASRPADPWSPDQAARPGPAYGLRPGAPARADLPSHSRQDPSHGRQDPFHSRQDSPHTRQDHPAYTRQDAFSHSGPDASPYARPEQGYGTTPSSPGAWPVHGHPTDTGQAPGGRRAEPRWPVLLAGGIALAVLLGVGGWLILRERAAAPDPGTGGPSVTATASPSAGTATPRPGRTLPAGWRLHRDPMGFSVAVPATWQVKRFPGRDRVEFRAPGSDAFLWIESTDDPEKDPVRHWEKVEEAGTADGVWPGYRRIGITGLTYRGVPAADWEFTYLKDGVRTHVLDRGFRTAADKPYAIYWESPEPEWKRSSFDAFARTFRP